MPNRDSPSSGSRPNLAGRGAQIDPANRFERIHLEDDSEQLECEDDGPRRIATEYFFDHTKSIVSENKSPDLAFRWSLNPYRGCLHGCSYCYARPTHEYLGMNAGLDFESKILVKPNAASLFRDWLARDAWVPEPITLSGVTDCYQPAERKFQVTRQLLEVALKARQPITIVTKNALVTRDLDILCEMAKRNTVAVALSITSLDQSLTRVMEPRTSSPAARLRAIEELTQAGVPTSVMVAPVIPGLNDTEIPKILEGAKNAGASSAAYTLLRLPFAVRDIFLDWLDRNQPLAKERVLSRIQATRGGRLSDSQFGRRMRGEGELARQIQNVFTVFARKLDLQQRRPLCQSEFRRPLPTSGQRRLFE
ncbi:MAG: PA0069 family radical SAM protein [Planctomycetes bacterium]|nr:PA0069 family radical SAM protein [Planctomycetota bacterium]